MGEIFKREIPRTPLEFTGERITSEVGGQIELEHCHRYFLARELARGLDVLDVASGEGYGSAYLSRVAHSVVGVDVDPNAVAHAQEQYGAENLVFKTGSATALPLPDHSVDAVFSFETIEHFYDHDRFLEEVRRVLRPDGIFVVSTPERDIYSPPNTASNPYHVRELVRGEFDALIARNFKYSGMLQQRVVLGSIIAPDRWPDQLGEPLTIERRGDDLFEVSKGLPRAPYLVAVASDAPLPAMGASFFIENGYVHDRERELAGMRAEEAQLRDTLAMMQNVIDERGNKISELEGAINELEGAAKEPARRIAGLEQALAVLTARLHEEQRRCQHTEDDLHKKQIALADVTRLRDEMMMSTTWQVGRPVRAVAKIVPAGLRRTVRRAIRVAWWIVTFRFPQKMRERRDTLARNVAPGP